MLKLEFGADGIRGLADQGVLLPYNAVQLGQALGQFVCRRSERRAVVIGRDTRPSGEKLLHCLVAGLTSQGIHVIDLGVMTTPGVAFLARWEQADLGLCISASHNPPEYNGLKIVGPNGLRLQREDEIEIEMLGAEGFTYSSQDIDTFGQECYGQHLIEVYVEDHIRRCPVNSLAGLKVVLDCANGAASRVAIDAFRRLGACVSAINDAVDGTNINYHCGSERARNYPEELAAIVRQYNAEYGFAFDGDGDRLTVVDANGQMFDGNDLLYVLAVHFSSNGFLREQVVVTTQLANAGLVDALKRAGIRTILASKGDKNLEAAMWQGDYLLGSEPTGNIIINDGHHTAADAVYTALVLGGIIIYNRPKSLAEIAAPLCKRPQVTLDLKLPGVSIPAETIQAAISLKQSKLGDAGRVLFWSATTEPGVFRIMAEGSCTSSYSEVARVAQDIAHWFRQRLTT